MTSDSWSRVDYRRLVAWPQRLEREAPFLDRVLSRAPLRRALDLGCATGEHSRHLASRGFEVVGVDASLSMLERAHETPLPERVRLIHGDIADVAALDTGPAGAAICLGNTLPHLDEDAMRRLATGLAGVLVPDAPFVLQILNYQRIRAKKLRHLPLNFREHEEGGETVFLRLMDLKPDGTVVFTPTTLWYRPDHDPPIEVMHTRSTVLRAWTWSELETIFYSAGFKAAEVYGGFDGSAFNPVESTDVLAVLTR